MDRGNPPRDHEFVPKAERAGDQIAREQGKEEAVAWIRERDRRMKYFLGQVGQRYVALALGSCKEIPGLSPGGTKEVLPLFRQQKKRP